MFFKTGLKVAVIKASFDLVTFFLGLSPLNNFHKAVSTFGWDILGWFTIFQILTFIIYIYTNNKKYILFSSLFFITLIFSYERTQLFVAIISNVLIFLYSRNYLTISKRRLLYKKVVVFSAIILFLIPIILKTEQGKDLYLRLASAIKFTGLVSLPKEPTKPEYSDSGHLKQSLLTTAYFLNMKIILGRRTQQKR